MRVVEVLQFELTDTPPPPSCCYSKILWSITAATAPSSHKYLRYVTTSALLTNIISVAPRRYLGEKGSETYYYCIIIIVCELSSHTLLYLHQSVSTVIASHFYLLNIQYYWYHSACPAKVFESFYLRISLEYHYCASYHGSWPYFKAVRYPAA